MTSLVCVLLVIDRQLYMKKCGELVDEKTLSEQAFGEQLDSAKQTMKVRTRVRVRHGVMTL